MLLYDMFAVDFSVASYSRIKWTSNRKKNDRWLFDCLHVTGCQELSSKQVLNNDSSCRQPSHISSRFQPFIQQWMQSPLLMGRERAFCASLKIVFAKNAHMNLFYLITGSTSTETHTRTQEKSSWMHSMLRAFGNFLMIKTGTHKEFSHEMWSVHCFDIASATSCAPLITANMFFLSLIAFVPYRKCTVEFSPDDTSSASTRTRN